MGVSRSAARAAAQGERFVAAGRPLVAAGTHLAAQGLRFVLSDSSAGTHRGGGVAELTASLKQTVRTLLSIA